MKNFYLQLTKLSINVFYISELLENKTLINDSVLNELTSNRTPDSNQKKIDELVAMNTKNVYNQCVANLKGANTEDNYLSIKTTF